MPLMFWKAPQNHFSTAYYLIFSFVICLNLVQILCHSRGNFARQASQYCDSRWWEEEGCLLSSLQRTRRKGRGRPMQGFHCPSSLYYHRLCPLLNAQGPFRLCICKNAGLFVFLFLQTKFLKSFNWAQRLCNGSIQSLGKITPMSESGHSLRVKPLGGQELTEDTVPLLWWLIRH